MYGICNFSDSFFNFLLGQEHTLVVFNHPSDIDWFVGWIWIPAQVHDLISQFHASCFLNNWYWIKVLDFLVAKACTCAMEQLLPYLVSSEYRFSYAEGY